MLSGKAGVKTSFFRCFNNASDVPSLAHSAGNRRRLVALSRAREAGDCRNGNERRAKQCIRTGGENFNGVYWQGVTAGLNLTRAPSDFPIQLCCIKRTRSGQRSSVSIAARSSSAYFVIFKNHCESRRRSTMAPERHPRPSTTCSLARTVFSSGSQLPNFPYDRRGLFKEFKKH